MIYEFCRIMEYGSSLSTDIVGGMFALNWILVLQKDRERLWLMKDLFFSFCCKPNFSPGFLILSLSAMLPFPVP